MAPYISESRSIQGPRGGRCLEYCSWASVLEIKGQRKQ